MTATLALPREPLGTNGVWKADEHRVEWKVALPPNAQPSDLPRTREKSCSSSARHTRFTATGPTTFDGRDAPEALRAVTR